MRALHDSTFSTIITFVLVSLVASYKCPKDCTCDVIESNNTSFNHAKCSSLEGLQGEDRFLPIHSLDLSHANIHRVSQVLEKLRDLTSLDLSHNTLSDIGRLGRRIRIIDLSHNKIKSDKLMKIPNHVEHLNLSHNEITSLPLELTKLKNLQSIDLSGNTINCTCETLEVRNWLQWNHVHSNNSVRCTYPSDVKDKSWLRVKQAQICEKEGITTRYISHNDNDEENDLMFSDDPVVNEGSGDIENFDELGKTFLLVHEGGNKKLDRLMLESDFPASGDGALDTHSEANLYSTTPSYDEVEGSGSGLEPLGIPFVYKIDNTSDITFENENITAAEEEQEEVSPLTEPVDQTTIPGDIFGPGLGMGIFEKSKTTTTTEEATSEIEEELIVPVDIPKPQAEVPPPSTTSVDVDVPDNASDARNASMILDDDSEGAIKEAAASENQSTYILLGVIVALLIVLIIFVAIKQSRARRRNRGQTDPESPRGTELLDMDKKNLGKPIQKNGSAERAPLMGDKSKADNAKPINGSKKVPYVPHDEKDGKAQQPLLKENNEPNNAAEKKIPGASQAESNNNVAPTRDQESKTPQAKPAPEVKTEVPKSEKDKPDSPARKGGYPPPKSKPRQGDDDVFLPSSPKTGRYSPVYSPETGRVKIKLLETPKPKTPLLVTRSTSNAGDIITTPTTNQTMPTGQ